MRRPTDVCARKTCGWYRNQHHDRGEGPRCPYHYRKVGKPPAFPTFLEPAPGGPPATKAGVPDAQ